jgi:hypothetical protein
MDDDIRDLWAAHRELSKQKRASNREESARILREAGLTFTTKNEGAHLVVVRLAVVVDFWPGTGLWISRNPAKRGRGVQPLINFLKGTKP